MPPKPPPGKKGADEVDMSDLASLPPLNSINFTVLYNKFFSHASREKLQKFVGERFPPERIKTLTRDEIITYGKGKQFILEPGQAQTLPHDDPRVKQTEAEQIAKAAQERLFEMQVMARRTKKERITKLEEEAKASGQPLQIDHDLLDQIFQLVDFPHSKDEAIAFAKLHSSLNCVYEVNQTFKTQLEIEDEELMEALQNQEQPLEKDAEGSDSINEEKTAHRLEQLNAARSGSTKTSPLRNLAFVKLNFVNFPHIGFKVNEQGEEHEVRKDAEHAFSDEINAKLEHFGALAVKYLRFREKVGLMPLAPDQKVLHTLNNLQGLSEDYKQWLSNVESLIASLDQQAVTDPSSSENVHQQKKEVEDEKVSKAADEEDRKKIIHDCRDKLKESMDDKYYLEKYDLTQYSHSFLPHKEGQNSIGSLMSAMVSQIAKENSYEEVYQKHVHQQQVEHEKSQSTAEETLDDLFESFTQSVNFDLQIWERPAYDANTSKSEIEDLLTAFGPTVKDRKNGARAYTVEQTGNGDVIEYNNELDDAKKALQKLNKITSITDEIRAEDICARTSKALDNLVLPGISQRHLMPPVPAKSQRLRDQERAAVYPFATLPVDDVERGLIMKAFQELIRSNQIDEGATNDKQRHSKFKVFERNFEEHMTPEILRQVLAEALLQEPDVATLYYPRDDSLLVALYNKVRSDRNRNTPDGERQWRAAYRIMPDFENWVNFFSENVVVEAQQGAPQVEGHPVRYQMDEEMIPETLLDIDDQKVSNIQESSQMFYPYDGSVMKVDQCSAGGLEFNKSIVLKDNIAFGLRKACDRHYDAPASPVEEHGLVSYKKVGDTDFWIRFENDTKVLVESVQIQRNPQKLIRIDPPKPTAEEIAAREEAIKQAQAAAAKNKGKPGAPGAPVIEEYKEPEPTWEPEPFDFLDTLFQDEQLQQQHFNQVTTTLPNGLLVQHLSDGNIVQMTQNQLLTNDNEEKDRLFLFASHGVVVRHLRNRDAEVLFPSGVKAVFTKQTMTWTVTNNKGYCTAKKAGVQWDLERVPCAYETDPVTGARMMIREDKVMTIEFQDGSLFCQHADGTLMRTSADRSEVRIEKEGYAPVVFKRGMDVNGVMAYPGRETSFAQEKVTPDQRSMDQVIVETHLPDGTVVDTYLDCDLTGEEEIGIQHIFNRPDFSVFSINQLNKIKVISSNARSALNEASQKLKMGSDTAYLYAINGDSEDMSQGVYTAYIGHQPKSSIVYINDPEKNTRYLLTSELKLIKQQIQEGMDEQEQLQLPNKGKDAALDILENISGAKNPFTKYYTLPRLFVIKNDGSGHELLTKEQLDYYFRQQKHSKESYKQRKDINFGTTQAKAHYYLTKVRTLHDREVAQTLLKSLEFPQNATYALLHLRDGNQKLPAYTKDGGLLQTQPDQYMFRQFIEFQPFEVMKQQTFTDDLERYKKWRLSQTRYETEFGIVHVPAKDGSIDLKKIEEEEQIARKIITKILKERKNQRQPFDAAEKQLDFLHNLTNDEDASDYQRRNSAGQLMLSDGMISPRNALLGNGGMDSTRSIKNKPIVTTEKKVNKEVDDKIRQLKKKQLNYIESQLQDIRRMVNTPVFIGSYYGTKVGQSFAKANPAKAVSPEVLMRMSQRIDRSQHQLQQAENEKAQHDGSREQTNPSPLGNHGLGDPLDKESPIVALEPEEPGLKQGSAFLAGNSKKLTKNPDGTMTATDGGALAPSLYLQEKMYLKQRETEHLLKAEEYHVVKTKDFNVVGRLRQDKPVVKVMQKSNAQTELNEKFITTECIADRRIKISSMAPRQYINAPSVQDVRKQGQHQMILSAINKKQTFAELINQANAMVTSVLHDPLKRSFNVMPSGLKFGILKTNQSYEMIVTMKNEDSVGHRIILKPLSDNRITASLVDMGPVAPGMIKKVSVMIFATNEGTIKDTLQIVTKADIFKIPIEATIMSEDNYEREAQEQAAIKGKSVTNSRVRERLNASIQKSRLKVAHPEKKKRTGADVKSQERRPVGEDGEEGEYYHDEMSPGSGDDNFDAALNQSSKPGKKEWIDTTNSESKLPVLPQADKRPFDVDAKKNLKDVLKK